MIRKEAKSNEDGQEYVVSPKAMAKGYVWFEMDFFNVWGQSNSQLLCVDTPGDLPDRLQKALGNTSNLEFRDPTAMYAGLLDQVILYYDISVWRVRDPVRRLEKVSC